MITTHLCRSGVNLFRIYSKQTFPVPNVLHTNLFNVRNFYSDNAKFQLTQSRLRRIRENSIKNYTIAIGILTLGMAFAAVPLYRIFCQATGFGGQSKTDIGGEKIEKMNKIPYRQIKITFTSDVGTNLNWKFKPQQKQITVVPGETALAFYTATNPLDRPVVGISTYNILPYEAAPYFNKIQCFCFEEQILNPKEQVDLPVFFYIDPEFCNDPLMERIDEIVLSYTFFAAKNTEAIKDIFKTSS